MLDIDVVKEFKRLANLASFHYADDSCKEWGQAAERKNEALAIFDAHPELETELRHAAIGELWNLEGHRPKAGVQS